MNPLSQRGARGVLQAESSVREGAWQANAPSVDSFHWTSNGKRWGPTTAFFHAIGFPISSRLVGRLSAHLQICQVTIHILQLLALSLDFCFVWAMLFFFFFFPRKSSLFQLFFCSDLENRARHWCLGDWVVFFGEGVYVFFMMWYTARETEHWVRTYQCQATFSAWYEDENDMRISEYLLSFCQYLRLLL